MNLEKANKVAKIVESLHAKEAKLLALKRAYSRHTDISLKYTPEHSSTICDLSADDLEVFIKHYESLIAKDKGLLESL